MQTLIARVLLYFHYIGHTIRTLEYMTSDMDQAFPH